MKNIFLMVVSLGMALLSNAQKNVNTISVDKYLEYAKNESEQMKYILKFSPAQLISVTEINKNYFLRIANLQNSKLSINARNDSLTKIQNERKESLQKVLSDSEQKKYFEIIAQQQNKWQNRQDSILTTHRKK